MLFSEILYSQRHSIPFQIFNTFVPIHLQNRSSDLSIIVFTQLNFDYNLWSIVEGWNQMPRRSGKSMEIFCVKWFGNSFSMLTFFHVLKIYIVSWALSKLLIQEGVVWKVFLWIRWKVTMCLSMIISSISANLQAKSRTIETVPYSTHRTICIVLYLISVATNVWQIKLIEIPFLFNFRKILYSMSPWAEKIKLKFFFKEFLLNQQMGTYRLCILCDTFLNKNTVLSYWCPTVRLRLGRYFFYYSEN